MHRGTLILAVCVALIGGWYLSQALTLPRGTLAQPGPGVYSILIGGLILATSIGTGVEGARSLRTSADVAINWPAPDGWLRILGLMGGAVIYLILVNRIGHLLATFVTCIVVMWTQGYASWPRTILWAALIAGATYLIFVKLLSVPFFGDSLLG